MNCKNCKKKLVDHTIQQLERCLQDFENRVENDLLERAKRQRLESQLGDK